MSTVFRVEQFITETAFQTIFYSSRCLHFRTSGKRESEFERWQSAFVHELTCKLWLWRSQNGEAKRVAGEKSPRPKEWAICWRAFGKSVEYWFFFFTLRWKILDQLLLFKDGIEALVNDCNYPQIRRNKNVENFVQRCKRYIFIVCLFSPVRYFVVLLWWYFVVFIDDGPSKIIQDNRLRSSDFQILKVIGRGAFGEVQLVRCSHAC